MTTINEQDESDVKKPSGIGMRHVQSLMMFLAMALALGVRNNMSMAIVAMTDPSLENTFDWSLQTQSVILSSYFWGYLILPVPSGMLSVRFGGKVLLVFAIAVNAIMSVLTPFGAYYGGWKIVCACRFILGLTQGLVVPAVYTLIGKWVPVEEKSRIGSIVSSGAQFGASLQIIMVGFVAAAWGWPAIFYTNAVAATIFVIVYVVIGADSPKTSRFISDQERLYIEHSLGQIGKPKKYKTPWKAMWTSVPFISLILVHCAFNWGYWTLTNMTPSYMSIMLNINIKANGVISALPSILMFTLSFPFGIFSDFLINRNILSVTATRKLSNSIGMYGPAIVLIALCYAPPGNVNVGVFLITAAGGLHVGRLAGFLIVHLDLSPNFAGIMIGITNMSSNIISIITPLAAGVIVQDETSASDWRKLFFIASAIYFVGNTQFLFFGTSVKQPWDEPQEDCMTDDTVKSADEKTEKPTEKVV